MRERDIEERLRSVVDGPKPMAPESLHRFLQELPEVEAQRGLGLLGRLRAAFPEIPLAGSPSRYARRAQLAFGVAVALLVGVAASGLLLSVRDNPIVLLGVSATPSGGPWVTPQGRLSSYPAPIDASFADTQLKDLVCRGLPSVGNENVALPIGPVVTQGSEYLGVTGGDYGETGLIHSTDGLYWDWTPPSAVSQDASILTSITSDQVDMIVLAGGAQGVDGTTDGRIWYSDNTGKVWREVPDESVFKGTTVRLVVYGSGQYIALGWNTSTAADSLRPIAEWRSVDGLVWTRMTTPIKGTSALVVATPAGFLLSGTPLVTGAIDELPTWVSPDGKTWARATASDNTAQLIAPLASVTVTATGEIYGTTQSGDGMTHRLVVSYDGGFTWNSIKPDDSMVYGSSISSLASLSTYNAAMGRVDLLFAVADTIEGAHVWVSENGGVTWMRVVDPNVGGPSGTMLLELGNGYLVGDSKILAYGAPNTGIGTWLLSLATNSN